MSENNFNTVPFVSISCITYNHAPYIRQCLDGFLMQKTTFPFEVLIHDDASTDGTTEIIKEYEAKYPKIIKPIYEEENQWVKGKRGSAVFNFPRAKGKYIALCEGDDYWIDSLKLQKQVDFLESNPEYGMVYTNFNIYYQKQKILRRSLFTTEPLKFPSRYTSLNEFIYKAGYVCPPSWLWRNNLPQQPSIQSCDSTFVLFAHFMHVTKVHMLPDVTVTYRYLEESASHSKDYDRIYYRNKNILETQLKLIDLYCLPSTLKTNCLKKYYSNSLPQFIIHDLQKDILESKQILTDPSIKDKILFSLNNPVGIFILRFLYRILSSYRNGRR